ncbi:MAG: energy transducer TonB [Deltaproteobacteria bacterium]|nr:energy transducer TonB [Deltaproteobacteria bacterium]
MQEKKEFPFLLIFILLSLLLHLGLAYHYRAWEPAAKALAELRRRQKKDIPVQIIELPKKEKRKEKPKPPPKKPSFLADRNQQTKTETTTEARAPKAAKVKPRPQKPAPPKPTAKPRPKVEPKPATKPKPASQPKATAATKPRPQIKSPGELSAAKKKETKTEVKKKAQPDIKKLFPSFEELTKISKEQERQNAPAGKRSPHTPNKLKRSTEVALNTLDYKFHSYYLALKRKIELVWEYPYKARRTGAQGRLLIRFVINLDGSLAEVKILRSSGVALLDSEAIRAVHNASPFPPLPERMNSKRLAVTATFEYLLSYRSVH